MISINFRRLAYYLTPVTKRIIAGVVAFRVKWLQYILKPLDTLMQSYNNTRFEQIIKANVTGQVKLLQWYLNNLFDNELRRIRIYHASDGGYFIHNHEESTPGYLLAYNEIEGGGDTYIYLNSELLGVLNKFYIEVPPNVNNIELTGVVEKYKAAGKLFEIIELNI